MRVEDARHTSNAPTVSLQNPATANHSNMRTLTTNTNVKDVVEDGMLRNGCVNATTNGISVRYTDMPEAMLISHRSSQKQQLTNRNQHVNLKVKE